MITGNKEQIIKTLEQTLEEGKYYAVDVMTSSGEHTREQENRFYKVCRILAETTGYTLGEMKSVLTSECFGEPRSIGGLTSKEMSELIDVAQRIAAEQGIYDVR